MWGRHRPWMLWATIVGGVAVPINTTTGTRGWHTAESSGMVGGWAPGRMIGSGESRGREVGGCWRRRLLLALPALLLVTAAPSATAGKKKAPPPELPLLHRHPSGRFTFRTPQSWSVGLSPEHPETLEAGGDGLLVRFIFREGEAGLDGLHVACLDERLAGPMETQPGVDYEYDFLSGTVSGFEVMDSAFVVRYDKPIEGHRKWRQRNLTLVGGGISLCAISYAPADRWKRSAETRALLDAVLESPRFEPSP